MDEARQHQSRRRRRTILGGAIGAIALGGALLWIDRRDLAGNLVDRRLAAAGVSGSYRIATLAPAEQVIEDVRIGDPARPDFVARRVALHWRYRLGWPSLADLDVDGGRLRASWRDGRLSFGAIDRLLPRSDGGGAALPDLRASLHDTHVALATPFGTAGAWIEGAGNLANGFHGMIRADATALAANGCTVRHAEARLAVRTDDREIRLRGPIAIGGADCGTLRLRGGGIGADVRLAPEFDRIDGGIALAGFAGQAGAVTFGPLRGKIGIAQGRVIAGRLAIDVRDVAAPQAHARSVSLDGRYRYAVRALQVAGRAALRSLQAAPAIGASSRSAAGTLRATPLGPIAIGVGDAVAGYAADSDIEAPFTLETGPYALLRIDRATVRARNGDVATVSLSARKEAQGWRAAATLAGAGLPQAALEASRRDAHSPLEAVIRVAPYRAGPAVLALAPIRLTRADGTTRFATVASLDGPLGSGRIEGLTVPIAGRIDAKHGLVVGEDCALVAFRTIRLAGMTLDPARARLCGAPLVAKPPSGAIRIAATIHDLALAGRSGGAPLSVQAATIRLAGTGFSADRLAMRLGAADDPTRLDILTLAGTLDAGMLRGRFTEADGAIGRVPLLLSGASGDWRLAGGALHLAGAIRVADRAMPPRFLPLTSRDVALDLVDGRIDARSSLQTPGRASDIVRVSLHHDLASGTGGAMLNVPGIAFARGALQPEMLTALTLGVVANVAGTIRGDGRIDWTTAGTTSSGTFGTDRLDLAAAFGPVTGIAGTIRFTDLLGLVSAPHQEARIAEINPGIAVADGVAHYRLIGDNRVAIEDAHWPFAGGTLALDPTTLDFGQTAERRLTFRVSGLDAAAFIQQLDFPNISATGTFDGRLPMIFDQSGGRIEDGALTARGPGTLAYVGELSNAQLGTMGKLAFDALKAIRYSGLDIALGGSLDGEIVTRVRFDGVRQATGDKGLVARMIRNLPFRFNIQIRAPFRGLVGSARSYANPALLLQASRPPAPIQPGPVQPGPVQPADSAPTR